MRLLKKDRLNIATLKKDINDWLIIGIDYGSKIGACFVNGSFVRPLWFLEEAKEFYLKAFYAKAIAKMIPNVKKILIVNAIPYIKNIKTYSFLIKQSAVLEYKIKRRFYLPLYTLNINESNIKQWLKKHPLYKYNSELSYKENKYQLFMGYISHLKPANIPPKEWYHVSDAFSLLEYLQSNLDICIAKITPSKQIFI